MANSVDLDEAAMFEPTHLFLHNLQTYVYIFICRVERGIHQI